MNNTDQQTDQSASGLRLRIHGLDPEALHSVNQTADLLNHSPDWIYRRIYQQRLESTYVAGRHVITGEQIADYLNGQITYGPVILAGAADDIESTAANRGEKGSTS